MVGMTYLSLLLTSPMQSWGYQSKFDQRTTLSHPTRSGVIGLICAALGIDRGDDVNLARLNEIELTTLVLKSGNRYVDFHTVGGGWDKKTNSQRICRKASGSAGDTVISRRHYVCDAKFGVIVSGNEKLLNEIALALKNPKWGLWLGRKACIPSEPIFQGLFPSYDEAKEKLCVVCGVEKEKYRIEEVSSFKDGTDSIQDNPINYERRQFSPRRINVTEEIEE